MLAVLFSFLTVAGSQRQVPPPQPCGSYLYQPAFCIDEVLRTPAEPYVPQPGDIMLRLDHSKFWRATHWMALAFDPNRSAIVFARPDGTPAILEAGPCDTMWIRTLDVESHLKEYADIGRVWIRRRRVPLTPEQSCRLTQFALAQDGKRFARGGSWMGEYEGHYLANNRNRFWAPLWRTYGAIGARVARDL